MRVGMELVDSGNILMTGVPRALFDRRGPKVIAI